MHFTINPDPKINIKSQHQNCQTSASFSFRPRSCRCQGQAFWLLAPCHRPSPAEKASDLGGSTLGRV